MFWKVKSPTPKCMFEGFTSNQSSVFYNMVWCVLQHVFYNHAGQRGDSTGDPAERSPEKRFKVYFGFPSDAQEMVYVKRSQHPKFNELFLETYREVTTQDRKCPNGTCEPTKGGCPC